MSTSEGGPARILVVDDEQAVRSMLAEFLASEGFAVETAADGGDALARLSAHGFDLVLSDVRMPGMSGMALLSAIRQSHHQVGVLIITGCEDVAMAVEAMKAGALDYIQKPFHLAKVATTVREALAK